MINDLEGQTSEKRTSTVEMQNAGIINWFKDFSSKNLERIKEDKYGENIEEERLNKIKELLLEKQSELEVSQQFGVNVDGLLENVVDPQMIQLKKKVMINLMVIEKKKVMTMKIMMVIIEKIKYYIYNNEI